jgi:translation initiation factor IF-3
LIDQEGDQAGVMPVARALEMAEAEGMDLVEIAPNAEPPVCRIMDYGKYRFEQAKKGQASKKKQKVTHVKEVKFRPGTEVADYQVKMRNVRRFLDAGDKVKVTLRFRGREMAHQELGAEMLKRVRDDLGDEAVVEQMPKMEGRQMTMMISAKKA